MPRRKIKNPLALAVLALLTEQPRHPYDMGRIMKERRKEQSINLNYGSLYMVVEQLTKVGFIKAEETIRDASRPERTVYALTDAGRTELYDWMRELISIPSKEFYTFEAGLALIGVLSPKEALSLLKQRFERLVAHTHETHQQIESALASGLDPAFLVELEYRLTLEEAEQHYVERLIERMMNDLDFARDWRLQHQEQEERNR
jgi:DNA-binding PadR family transcriptional regulator